MPLALRISSPQKERRVQTDTHRIQTSELYIFLVKHSLPLSGSRCYMSLSRKKKNAQKQKQKYCVLWVVYWTLGQRRQLVSTERVGTCWVFLIESGAGGACSRIFFPSRRWADRVSIELPSSMRARHWALIRSESIYWPPMMYRAGLQALSTGPWAVLHPQSLYFHVERQTMCRETSKIIPDEHTFHEEGKHSNET